MPSLNGKRVDIPYDEKTERFRSWFFPNEKKNSIDVTVFVLFVTGNRINMIYILSSFVCIIIVYFNKIRIRIGKSGRRT